MNNHIYNRHPGISGREQHTLIASTHCTVRVLVFFTFSIEYWACENSIRPYSWFHFRFTLSPFCSVASIPFTSFSFPRSSSARFHITSGLRATSLARYPYFHPSHYHPLYPRHHPVNIATRLAGVARPNPFDTSPSKWTWSAAGSCD